MNIDYVKCFDSGIIVGVYVVFIDVLLEEYGEGSFIKGFYIFIFIDLFLLEFIKGCGLFLWVLIFCDGG